jgi:hypothetical protein
VLKLIIFLADGRLGNQIFQYAFLKTIQKNNEKIIVSGFEDLKEVFEIDDFININKNNRLLRVIIFRICGSILYFLSDKKIISSIVIKHEKVLNNYIRESTTFYSIQGIVKKITFIKLGFFQSEVFFDNYLANSLKIKKKYLITATELLNSIPNNYHKIFVHIRRNDYKNFTVCGQSTLLPMSYYKDQIEWFIQNRKDSFFIFLGDDTKGLSDEFQYVKNKMISRNQHFGTDLAIMTQCNSAILSASSFSWWGSYMMRERDTVFAPKFWLGFRSKLEYQAQGVPSYSKEVEIA